MKLIAVTMKLRSAAEKPSDMLNKSGVTGRRQRGDKSGRDRSLRQRGGGCRMKLTEKRPRRERPLKKNSRNNRDRRLAYNKHMKRRKRGSQKNRRYARQRRRQS